MCFLFPYLSGKAEGTVRLDYDVRLFDTELVDFGFDQCSSGRTTNSDVLDISVRFTT